MAKSRKSAQNSIPVDIAALTERGPELMISVSGVRGTIPAGLDPVNILYFCRAFAAVTGRRIVVGEDARPSGPVLKSILVGTLLAAGKSVIDVGLVPTPTVKAAVARHGDAGVMISASHNPLNWNGFKFMGRGGFFFDAAMFEQWRAAMRTDAYRGVEYRKLGAVTQVDAIADHIRSVLKVIPNVAEIRAARYEVLVDAVAGAGREALPKLLEELGCRVIRLYCDPSAGGEFPRPPEPTPTALKEFGRQVRSKKVAVGFALDPDADRLVTGSPKRGAVNEEYTLPLAFLGLAAGLQKARNRSQVPGARKSVCAVVNLSTATLIDAVAAPFGVRVLRAPVGEANVVGEMRATKSLFGGEGNGGVIHPGVPSYGRDSLIGVALILSAMARARAKTLDELLDPMPALHMEKTKFGVNREKLSEVFGRLERELTPLPDGIDRRDGLRLVFGDGSWVHVRASNTEPIVRVIAQAPTAAALGELIRRAEKIVR